MADRNGPGNVAPDANLVLVPRYLGMSRQDAIRLRFGVDEVPEGVVAVLVKKAAVPEGADCRWREMDLGPAECEAVEAFRVEARRAAMVINRRTLEGG